MAVYFQDSRRDITFSSASCSTRWPAHQHRPSARPRAGTQRTSHSLMTLHTGHPRDGGSVTVLVAALLPALLLVFALVVDGANQLRVQSRADAVAAESARAAGTAINTRGTSVELDPTAARHAAQHYLAASGHTGTITVSPGGTVRATAHHTEPAAIGLLSPTADAIGEATAAVGVGTSAAGNVP